MFQPKVIIMVTNIGGVIIMSQDSFKSFLYIDYLILSATYKTASINSTITQMRRPGILSILLNVT